MKFFFATLIAFSATIAHADMIKMANLDVFCTEDGVAYPKVLRVVSSSAGSEVTIDINTFKDGQLTGGTEGGDPYLQTVNNAGGYNITISGGDFQKAFEGTAVKSGRAKAFVDYFNQRKKFHATCVGSYEFTPMPSALPAMPPIPPGKTVTPCVPDLLRAATILTAAAEELATLKKDHIDLTQSVTCEQIKPGVVEYLFNFNNCGMCLPKKAELRVEQDETPMYRDGPSIYKKQLTYK